MTSVTTGSEQILLPPKRTVITETITESEEVSVKLGTKITEKSKNVILGTSKSGNSKLGSSKLGTKCEAIVRPPGGFQRKRRTSGAGSTEVFRSTARSYSGKLYKKLIILE